MTNTALPCTQVIGLILSDVIGDPLDVIASGPTVPSTVSNSEVLYILEKYKLMEKMPPSISLFLNKKETEPRGNVPVLNGQYSHVQNLIVGSNKVATTAACERARELGYNCHVWSHQIQGEAQLLGQAYAKLAYSILQWNSLIHEKEEQPFIEQELFQEISTLFPELKEVSTALLKMTSLSQGPPNHPICLISSGEPTVTVKGNGQGGRNQELALAFSIELQQQLLKTPLQSSINPSGSAGHNEKSCPSCLFLSIGTDGQDGPCDSAGAVVDMETIAAAIEQGIDPVKHLDDNNSYSFFSSVGGGQYMIKTGLTGTNVMDLHVLVVSSHC